MKAGGTAQFQRNFLSTQISLNRIDVGGVLIEFANTFIDIPAVVVTPVIGDVVMTQQRNSRGEFGNNPYRLPYAVVEHVTRSQVFIKTGLLVKATARNFDFTPVSFNFVAVGPVK
jgi:hypothetical protein